MRSIVVHTVRGHKFKTYRHRHITARVRNRTT